MPRQQPLRLTLDRMETPIGTALLAVDEEGFLRAFDWADYADRQLALLRRFAGAFELVPGAAPEAMQRDVDAYFGGDLAALGRIAWRTGGTAFQLQCWNALCDIPAGGVSTYARQAIAIERPKAVRAVGLANGANPVGVIVPCHRVIGADGSLTGYGGGLWRKRWLLRHEGVTGFQDHGDLFDVTDDLERARAAG